MNLKMQDPRRRTEIKKTWTEQTVHYTSLSRQKDFRKVRLMRDIFKRTIRSRSFILEFKSISLDLALNRTGDPVQRNQHPKSVSVRSLITLRLTASPRARPSNF